MRPLRPISFAWLSLLLTGILLVSGCDNTLEPFAEKGAYSVQGYLNIYSTKQFIRVKPLTVPITKVDSNTLAATVTLENLTEGTSEVLSDSVVTYTDAQSTAITHNYWTDTPIPPRTKYRLTVDGPAGTVQSTTVTPTGTRPDVIPRKAGCRDEVTVVFKEMKSRRRHRARVEVKPPDVPWFPILQHDSPRRGYNFGLYNTDEGWLAMTFVPENLVWKAISDSRSNTEVPDLPPDKDPNCWDVNICSVLRTNMLKIWFLYLGPEWYGDIPKDSLTYDPLESYDVTGGLGFFGAVAHDWVPFFAKTSPRFFYTGGRRCAQPPPGS